MPKKNFNSKEEKNIQAFPSQETSSNFEQPQYAENKTVTCQQNYATRRANPHQKSEKIEQKRHTQKPKPIKNEIFGTPQEILQDKGSKINREKGIPL